MLVIDKYAYNNKLTKTNPVYKAGLVLLSLLTTIAINNNYINVLIFFTMFLLTTGLAGIGVKDYLRILSIPLGFLILSMITILLSISSKDSFILSVRFINKYIGISKGGLMESISLFTRSLGAISSTFFLGLTTPLNQIIKLLKKIKLPQILIELIVLIYRFIFIFLEEAEEIYRAQEIRFGYISIGKGYKSLGLIIKSLFIRVLLKYQEMIVALECKLYDGEFKIGD